MEADHQRTRVRGWFMGLSPADRAAAVTVHDHGAVGALREMHAVKSHSGDCFFYADDDIGSDRQPFGNSFGAAGGIKRSRRRSSGAPGVTSGSMTKDGGSAGVGALRRLSGNVCYRRTNALLIHPTEEAREADLRLEQGLRLCDTERYLDTLTVSPEWLSTPARARDFVRTMEVVSRGGFLRETCCVRWDDSQREWRWDDPAWFRDMGFHSLAAFAASRLERALWAFYFEAHNLDPRGVGEKRSLGARRRDGAGSSSLRSALDPLRTGLRAFWRELSLPERKRLVEERIGDLVGEILREDFTDTPGLLGSWLDMSMGVKGHETLISFKGEVLFSSDAFVEFVYLSPIARAGTPVDRLLRKVCHRLQCACSDRMALELIASASGSGGVGEKGDDPGRTQRARRKKKKGRPTGDASSSVNRTSSSPSLTSVHGAGHGSPGAVPSLPLSSQLDGGASTPHDALDAKSRRNSDGGAPASLACVDEEGIDGNKAEGSRGKARRRRLNSEGTEGAATDASHEGRLRDLPKDGRQQSDRHHSPTKSSASPFAPPAAQSATPPLSAQQAAQLGTSAPAAHAGGATQLTFGVASDTGAFVSAYEGCSSAEAGESASELAITAVVAGAQPGSVVGGGESLQEARDAMNRILLSVYMQILQRKTLETKRRRGMLGSGGGHSLAESMVDLGTRGHPSPPRPAGPSQRASTRQPSSAAPSDANGDVHLQAPAPLSSVEARRDVTSSNPWNSLRGSGLRDAAPSSKEADHVLAPSAPMGSGSRAQQSASKSEGEEEVEEDDAPWEVVTRWSSERRLAPGKASGGRVGGVVGRGRASTRAGLSTCSGRNSPLVDHQQQQRTGELRRSHSQTGSSTAPPVKSASTGGTPAERVVPIERRNSAPTRNPTAATLNGVVVASVQRPPLAPTASAANNNSNSNSNSKWGVSGRGAAAVAMQRALPSPASTPPGPKTQTLAIASPPAAQQGKAAAASVAPTTNPWLTGKPGTRRPEDGDASPLPTSGVPQAQPPADANDECLATGEIMSPQKSAAVAPAVGKDELSAPQLAARAPAVPQSAVQSPSQQPVPSRSQNNGGRQHAHAKVESPRLPAAAVTLPPLPHSMDTEIADSGPVGFFFAPPQAVPHPPLGMFPPMWTQPLPPPVQMGPMLFTDTHPVAHPVTTQVRHAPSTRRRSLGEVDPPSGITQHSTEDHEANAKRRAGSLDNDTPPREEGVRVSTRSAPPSPHPSALQERPGRLHTGMMGYPVVSRAPPPPPPLSAWTYADDALGKEMRDFVDSVHASDNGLLRRDIILRVQQLVRGLWPHARVEVYGSCSTGLCLPSSDIDLVVCGLDPPPPIQAAGPAVVAYTHLIPLMGELAAALDAAPWCACVRCIQTARVPVIKLVGCEGIAPPAHLWGAGPPQVFPGCVPIDITFETGGAAVHRGLAARDFLRARVAAYPALAPLLLVLKDYLRVRGLNDVYTGGLGSYSLALMAVYFVGRTMLGPPYPPLGSLLVDFLLFYSQFDFTQWGISVASNSVVPHALPDRLVIEDPCTPGANVGSGSFMMWRVQAAFAEAYHLLAAPLSPRSGRHPQPPQPQPSLAHAHTHQQPIPQHAGHSHVPPPASPSAPVPGFVGRLERLLSPATWYGARPGREGGTETMEFEAHWPPLRGRLSAPAPSSKRSRSTDDALSRERQ
eukprot:Opistho-2@84066